MKDRDTQEISNIAYALANMGYFEKRVFDAVAGQLERQLEMQRSKNCAIFSGRWRWPGE